MRDLSSYLHRRNIRTQTDRDAWAEKNGIDSHVKLMQFCESKSLKCTGTWVFRISKPESNKKIAEQRVEAAAETEAWHVPAAERPISRARKPAKSSSARGKKTTRQRNTKKKIDK